MRVLFALPGLHRYARGAEIALISIASELAKNGARVTLIGSGEHRVGAPYRFLHAASVSRETFESLPSIPALRDECAYEELTFVPNLLRQYRPNEYDVTVACSYPFVNWALRRPTLRGSRPPHVFITQNGDWPVHARNAEYRFFGCEGLVCTNPDFYERNKQQWRCRLIGNGVDCERFRCGFAQREMFSIPTGRFVVLMVSALISSKRVGLGIDAVSRIPDAHFVVAGDGPLRRSIDAAGAQLLPGRYTRLSVPSERMPALYQSADVFLHLSRDEPFGNVLLEAMACGLPVVAHDSPRSRWILGHDEFLVDSDDALAISGQIELARHAAAAARLERAKRATAFSWKNVGAMYWQFLQEVVSAT